MCLGIAVLALLLAAPLWAGWDEQQQRLSLTGSLRARYELWNWFDPGNRAALQDNNDYGFGATLLRLGLRYDTKPRSGLTPLPSCKIPPFSIFPTMPTPRPPRALSDWELPISPPIAKNGIPGFSFTSST
jgi:hypothetical protein